MVGDSLLSLISLFSLRINFVVSLFLIRGTYHSRGVQVWVELCDFPQRPFTGGCLQQKWWDWWTMSSKNILSTGQYLARKFSLPDNVWQNIPCRTLSSKKYSLPDSVEWNILCRTLSSKKYSLPDSVERNILCRTLSSKKILSARHYLAKYFFLPGIV